MKNTMNIIHQTTGTPIAFCYGAKAYKKYMKKHYGLDEEIPHTACTMILTKKNTFSLVIGTKKLENIYQLKGVITHELSHTVTELMQYYGFECDEFRSYTLQWLYQEIMPALDEKLLKDSIKRDKKAHKSK